MAPKRSFSRKVRKTTTAPRDRAWSAMRILRKFTIPEICATAEIHPVSFKKYLKLLMATGYVIKTRNHTPSHGECALYSLVRNTGPFRPWAQSNGVIYDRNIAQEFTPGEVRHE